MDYRHAINFKPHSRTKAIGRKLRLAALALLLPIFLVSGARHLRKNQHDACQHSHCMDSSLSSVSVNPTNINFSVYVNAKTQQCSPSEAYEKAANFRNKQDRSVGWSGCGGTKFFDEFARLDSDGQKIILDIGCNKGYTSAKMFGLWAPDLGFTPKSLRLQTGVPCGACGDCNEDLYTTHSSAEKIQVFCIEPSQKSFAQLLRIRDKFFNSSIVKAEWLTLNMAMTNATRFVKFSKECFRDEMCSLGVSGAANDVIGTTTIDKFALDLGLHSIDVLKIDTEGYDATVLQGAAQTLSKRKVGLLVFEYHRLGVWKEYKLEHIINWLDTLNYVCYFDSRGDGSTGMYARITGCWSDLYEFYKWSNVACVKREERLHMHFEGNLM